MYMRTLIMNLFFVARHRCTEMQTSHFPMARLTPIPFVYNINLQVGQKIDYKPSKKCYWSRFLCRARSAILEILHYIPVVALHRTPRTWLQSLFLRRLVGICIHPNRVGTDTHVLWGLMGSPKPHFRHRMTMMPSCARLNQSIREHTKYGPSRG